MVDFLDESAEFEYSVSSEPLAKIYKQPPQPLTTSRLQQAASNELHISPKDTMKLCQSLYEGGYITYMRTDSQTYSNEFKESAKEYILKNYDERHLNKMLLQEGDNGDEREGEKKKNTKPKTKKNDKKVAPAEAHEAIRPTKIALRDLPEKMDTREKRMYRLIWQTTVESCMSPASFYSITSKISAPENTTFKTTQERIDFPGWLAISLSNKFVGLDEEKVYQILFNLKQSTASTKCIKIVSKVSMKETKQHYTEARLVQLLEDNGIGRPSTFSSLVDKIQERGYVKKQDVIGKTLDCNDYEMTNGEIFEIETKREFGNEKGKLVIQPLGVIVLEFLEKHFADLFNYEYTKKMEDSLDEISKGKTEWSSVCKDCFNQIDNLMNKLDNEE
jgi:DNA topoisomerase-1